MSKSQSRTTNCKEGKQQIRPGTLCRKNSIIYPSVSSLPVVSRFVPQFRLPNFKGQKRDEIDDLLIQALHEENISFSFLDNIFFKGFVGKLNRTYRIPISDDVRSNNLSCTSARADNTNPTSTLSTYTSSNGLGKTIQMKPVRKVQRLSACSETNFISQTPPSPNPSSNLCDLTSTTPPMSTSRNRFFSQSQNPSTSSYSVAFGKCKEEVQSIVSAAEFVVISAKCFRLCSQARNFVSHLMTVFIYTPQPFLFEKEFSFQEDNYYQQISRFAYKIMRDVGSTKIVALFTDSTPFCSVLARVLNQHCPWIWLENQEDSSSSSILVHLLSLLNPAKRPEFSGKALEFLSEKLMLHPNLRSTKLIMDWAHWAARTGVFGMRQRPYAWTSDILEGMDAFTWWKGFFADSPLATLYTMLNLVSDAKRQVGSSWTRAEQLIKNETSLMKNLDMEGASRMLFVRFNEYKSTT